MGSQLSAAAQLLKRAARRGLVQFNYWLSLFPEQISVLLGKAWLKAAFQGALGAKAETVGGPRPWCKAGSPSSLPDSLPLCGQGLDHSANSLWINSLTKKR